MAIQYKILSFIITSFFVGFILFLVRGRKLKESLSLIWFLFSLVIITITFSFGLVEKLAELMKIKDPNNLLFFFAIVFVISACIIISVEISSISHRIKVLAQEFSLFKDEVSGEKK